MKSSYQFFGFLGLLFITSCASEKQDKKYVTVTFEEIDYGLYTGEDTSFMRNGRLVNSALGFYKTTDRVPMNQGVNFGTLYIMKSDKKSPVETKITWTLPAPLSSLDGEKNKVLTYTHEVNTGDTILTGYQLEEPEELLPGPWKMVITVGNQKLYERVFELYAPGRTIDIAQ